MAILLTGAGGLFTKLGHFFGTLDDCNSFRGNAANARVLSGALLSTRVAQYQTDFAGGTAEQKVLEGLYSAAQGLGGGVNGWMGFLAGTLCPRTLIDMAQADTPLSSPDVPHALALLYSQMVSSGAHVTGSTVAAGAQTVVGSPVGNPVVVMSVVNLYGQTLQYVFPETLTFTCTGDSNGGGPSGLATANQEPFGVLGQPVPLDPLTGVPSAPSPLDYLWPAGSGLAVSLSAVDCTLSNTTGNNILQNSDFITATNANMADNWINTGAGALGTDVLQAASGGYATGDGYLEFVGTAGAVLNQVAQPFNTATSTTLGAGGTPYKLTQNIVVQWSIWYKVSATPGAGNFVVELVDSTGAVIADDAATNNRTTQSLTAATSTWANLTGTFRMPFNLPANVPYKIQIRQGIAIDNGKNVFFSHFAAAVGSQLYGGQGNPAGGPYCTIFSGKTKPIASGTAPDQWTVALTNTFGVFQKWFQRVFSMTSLGIQLPTTGGGTAVNDNLVT